MTESDIGELESSLNVSLPDFYRTTMLNYPFPADSFATEFLLQNDPEAILDSNQQPDDYPGIGKPFVIGSDGGEEIYFLDIAADSSQVFTFDIETGKLVENAKDWTEFLSQIKTDLKEIEDDEKAKRERKASKKSWEFWK